MTGFKAFLNNRFRLIFIILIIIAACTVYIRITGFQFTGNDDTNILQNHQEYLKNFSNIPDAFSSDAWYGHQTIELYRPLQNISFFADAHMGNNICFNSHLVNLILHILTCISIFFLFSALSFNNRFAFAGGLIYAVHYLFLHTVAWIPARGDLLLALFSVWSVIAFIKLFHSGKWYWYAINLVAFSLAVFSKESGIVLPLVFLAYLVIIYKSALINLRNLLLFLFYTILILVFFHLRNLAISDTGGAFGIFSVFKNLPTIPEVTAKFFFPVNFSTMPFFHFTASAAGILIILIFTVFIIVRKKYMNGMILFSALWFILFLLPGMAYRPDFTSYSYEYLDHRDYLPVIGILIILLSLVSDLQTGKMNIKPLISGAFVLILLYLITVNYLLCGIYSNPLQYSESAISNNEHCALGYFIHANEFYKSGQKDDAFREFTKAVNNDPDFSDARFNRACLLNEAGKFSEALADASYLVKSDFEHRARTYNLRGVIRINMNNLTGAQTDLEEALKLDPDMAEARKNQSLLEQKLIEKAVDPSVKTEANDLNNRGIDEAKKGNLKIALDYFKKALALYPGFTQAMLNIGNCWEELGNMQEACEMWEKASKLGDQTANGLIAKFCSGG